MRGLNSGQKAAVLRLVRYGKIADLKVRMEALVRRGYATWSTPAGLAIKPTDAARTFAATGRQLGE